MANQFRLLEAEALLWRGMYEDALHVLDFPTYTKIGHEPFIERMTIEGAAYTRLHQFSAANERLTEAEGLCTGAPSAVCIGVPRARGILAMEQGQPVEARRFFLTSLNIARMHQDKWEEATALNNLGWIALQTERYDEAVDWSRSANREAEEVDAQDLVQKTLGNLGWAYFELGDSEGALKLFLDAEKHAARLGNIYTEIGWMTNAGFVYQHIGELARAANAYHRALDLARQIDSKDDIIITLEVLAHLSIEQGNLDQATAYLDQLNPLLQTNGNRVDILDVVLAQAEIAAARQQSQQAKDLFRTVERDPDSQTSMRLGAEHQLARLFEREGDTRAAADMYKTALTTFESARAQLKEENSKLPFLANATPIYDDSIHFMVTQGRPDVALLSADQSRARTLAQGLGILPVTKTFQPRPLSPRAVAQAAGATLLFYWLGETQSYLWAVTPQKVSLFPLPAESKILPLVERYRKALLGPADPLAASNQDGLALYQILVAPAAGLLPRTAGAPVMILADGALSQLNFETLLVPGPKAHYWIEDATVMAAPSLSMLAAAKPSNIATRRLLLMGDAVAPSDDYPPLPEAATEMSQVGRHFAVQNESVLARQQATPAAFFASRPQQFSYIHFVAHGTASRTDPLDSAIILSPTSAGSDGGFKLYAREIMQHPIDARLVTIAGCYSSGTRNYKGEGLVGLSWAFLRAGAHSVIGALWEVSDESTPRLMDTLYQGLEEGETPAVALRRAKLTLLHSQNSFRTPFYWAPFQIYTRQ